MRYHFKWWFERKDFNRFLNWVFEFMFLALFLKIGIDIELLDNVPRNPGYIFVLTVGWNWCQVLVSGKTILSWNLKWELFVMWTTLYVGIIALLIGIVSDILKVILKYFFENFQQCWRFLNCEVLLFAKEKEAVKSRTNYSKKSSIRVVETP